MQAFFAEFGRIFFNKKEIYNQKFDINEESPFNLDRYPGRVGHFYAILDPRTLLKTNEEINACVASLELYKKRKNKIYENNDLTPEFDHKQIQENSRLWDAKRIVSSAIHPDTNEIIPWPFRFSAFPVINIPISTLLLFPGSNSLQVFAQFINQSYNVSVNYYNRNASNPMSNTTLGISYLSAVTMSCSIALGLRKFGAKYIKNKNGLLFRSFIPYTALTLASSFNVYFIRWNEITEGITLKYKKRIVSNNNNNGNNSNNGNNKMETIANPNDYIIEPNETHDSDIEWIESSMKSKRAGHIALAKCCVARFVWSIPPMFLPPIIMKLFNQRVWYKNAPFYQRLLIESLVIGGVLLTTIPPSLAVFPQKDKVSIKWLEPEFKQFVKQQTGIVNDSEIDENTFLYFNKGL